MNTTIGIRSMHWGVGETSIHHRSENTYPNLKMLIRVSLEIQNCF